MDPAEVALRRQRFRELHESGCFAIPNPWDVGSARYLRHLGFKAVATTSAGFAFSRGLPDAEWTVPKEAVLDHVREIVDCVDLPVNADFESGYADEPEELAQNVLECIRTGVAGFSIEDRSSAGEGRLYDMPVAIDRIRAARAAIDWSGSAVMLTARTECFLVGYPEPHKEALHRLLAFADAGADVLFAPGVREPKHIRNIVDAVRPKPVNVLVGSADTGLTMQSLAEMGVRRVSVGSSFARAAWGGFLRAAKALAEQGSFEGLTGAPAHAELNAFFHGDWASRRAKK